MAKSKADIVCPVVIRLLREKRVALGLSMNFVAQRSRMSHTMISRVERELRRPTLDTLFRMAEAMKIDLWPILKKAEKEFDSPPKGD